jgi:hypothetical protein
VHGRQSRGALLSAWLSNARRELAQSIAGSSETLVDIRFAGEQPMRDLADAETTEGLQRQHQLRFLGDRVVAANEEHPQQADGLSGRPATFQLSSAAIKVDWAASSIASMLCAPTRRERVATSLPYSCRKKCSTSPGAVNPCGSR